MWESMSPKYAGQAESVESKTQIKTFRSNTLRKNMENKKTTNSNAGLTFSEIPFIPPIPPSHFLQFKTNVVLIFPAPTKSFGPTTVSLFLSKNKYVKGLESPETGGEAHEWICPEEL